MAYNWERHLHRGINCCQINDWFWVIWPWGIHPRHLKKFLTVPFLRYSFWLGAPPMAWDKFFCQKTTDFGWYEGAECIPALYSLYDNDKLGDNIPNLTSLTVKHGGKKIVLLGQHLGIITQLTTPGSWKYGSLTVKRHLFTSKLKKSLLHVNPQPQLLKIRLFGRWIHTWGIVDFNFQSSK